MKKLASIFTALSFVCLIIMMISGAGCANIIPPGGGPRDSIPPILIAESPRDSATNVTTKKITFVFNEYIELQDQQKNILVSPTPNNSPIFDYHLRTITVRWRDTLEPNTTYSINFGNSIKDINEGNVFKDFSYVFSTGDKIDAFTLSGKVILAETGKIDTTLVAILHKNIDDSAVAKERPRYIARVNNQGNFTFTNLPAGTFALYALPDDYGHRYDDTKLFAFADKPVTIGATNAPVNLSAFVETIKKTTPTPAATPARGGTKAEDKRLKFTTNLQANTLSVLTPLQINFNRKVASFDTNKIVLTNNSYAPLKNYTIKQDTSRSVFTINSSWPLNTEFNLIMAADAFTDSAGNNLAKIDTVKFKTKNAEAYGSVRLRFNNLDTSKHPVLLLLQNDVIIHSIPLNRKEWSQKLFEPGDYDMRILFDANSNGKWDTGKFFGKHQQPETVISINDKLVIKGGGWDNERDISW